MPNHFHFLLRIKNEEELIDAFPKFQGGKDLQGFENLAGLISNQFSKFFNSYAKAFNKQQSRKGSLFMKNFKRKKISDEKYLRKIIHYIHYNPLESGLCEKPENWKYSSYNALLSERQTTLRKEEVMDWFEDKENFIYCHRLPPKETGIE
jgi:REP element-mobilizing transposase RayT